jgi:hypothetical protein
MKTGALRIRRQSECEGIGSAMKIHNRTLFGVISCLLLSAGLAKAAQQLDPLTKSVAVQGTHAGSSDVSAMQCTSPCDYRRSDVSAMQCTSPCDYRRSDVSAMQCTSPCDYLPKQ